MRVTLPLLHLKRAAANFIPMNLPIKLSELITKKMNTKLFVGNLSQLTTTEDLRMLFARTGPVVSVEMIKDRDTGKHKGFAFVEMISQSDAGKAVSEYNGYLLDRHKLNVMPARNQGGNTKPRRVSAYTEYKSYNESINTGHFSSRERKAR